MHPLPNRILVKETVMKTARICLAMLFAPLGAGLVTLSGCGSEPTTPQEQKVLINDSQASLRDLETTDPTLTDKINSSAGYAIFPNVGKGAAGIEVVSGNGDVYLQGGKYLGSAHVGAVAGGLALGGETYAELILFQNQEALNDFENNKVQFDASASAVALQAGAASQAKFENGTAVFIQSHGGLIASAVIGGQQFTFKAANPQPATQP
jgi:hypothetical protein